MTPVWQVQVEEADLERFAADIAERVAQRVGEAQPTAGGEWLNSRAAAAHLGLSLDSLHKLTARRDLAFSQESPGGKCWFRRSDLDAYRQSQIVAPRVPSAN